MQGSSANRVAGWRPLAPATLMQASHLSSSREQRRPSRTALRGMCGQPCCERKGRRWRRCTARNISSCTHCAPSLTCRLRPAVAGAWSGATPLITAKGEGRAGRRGLISRLCMSSRACSAGVFMLPSTSFRAPASTPTCAPLQPAALARPLFGPSSYCSVARRPHCPSAIAGHWRKRYCTLSTVPSIAGARLLDKVLIAWA